MITFTPCVIRETKPTTQSYLLKFDNKGVLLFTGPRKRPLFETITAKRLRILTTIRENLAGRALKSGVMDSIRVCITLDMLLDEEIKFINNVILDHQTVNPPESPEAVPSN